VVVLVCTASWDIALKLPRSSAGDSHLQQSILIVCPAPSVISVANMHLFVRPRHSIALAAQGFMVPISSQQTQPSCKSVNTVPVPVELRNLRHGASRQEYLMLW